VNGQLLFARGANWIPADALPGRLTEEHYRRLLGACLKANMNMIRLWGGGLYEADIFYEFCDENGLLIWHDFMFAVGPYLADEAYLESVRAEVGDVVRRLRHHPSIALWCGNNESESNMGGGQSWLSKYPTATWADYDKIFHEAIPQTAQRYDPDRPYWPSSPHHPLDRGKERPDWETSSGNAHTYDVWGDGLPFSTFDQMGQYRFVAEFGYQSLPDLETIRGMTAPEDRYFPSHVLEHHENSGNGKTSDLGTARIARHLAANLGMPSSLDDWVYLSQVLQAEGIRRGVEALRRNHPQSTGALFWQLDDNWPVISWSSIDYHGRWKALHYQARRFFSPVLVSAVVEDSPDPVDLGQRGEVRIWGVNDLLHQEPATLQWWLARFDGTEVKRGEQDVVLPANRGALLAELDFEREVAEAPDRRTYRKESYENRRQYYLAYRLVQGERELSSNVSFFVPPKYLALRPPGLRCSARKVEDRWVVDLVAEGFAAFVHVGLRESYALFSDNDFHLLPGQPRTIEVLSAEVPEDQIAGRLFAWSLIDSRRGAAGAEVRPGRP
jgi:beta-mannosidase